MKKQETKGFAGTAYFSLVFSGSDGQETVTVVCSAVKGNVTDIKFKPYHLWAIEKMNNTTKI